MKRADAFYPILAITACVGLGVVSILLKFYGVEGTVVIMSAAAETALVVLPPVMCVCLAVVFVSNAVARFMRLAAEDEPELDARETTVPPEQVRR